MRYLVTGAAGFIGSATARELIRRGDEVVTIDNLTTGSVDNIPKEAVFIKGNTYDKEVIEVLDNYKFDAIIHIAGQSSGEISFEHPVYDLQTNVQSTLMLLDYAKGRGIKRFVFASSMSVYGEGKNGYANEDTMLSPKSFYAVGKMASENYMRIYAKEYGLFCTALRFFNVYGVGQNMANLKQGMASIYLAQALRDKQIIVKGSKDRYRDFVYIDDVVKSVCSALDNEKGFHVYNVCTGKKTTVEELISYICEGLGDGKLPIIYTDGTPGDQFGIYGDYSRIFKELKWKPEVELKDGLYEMIRWAREQL